MSIGVPGGATIADMDVMTNWSNPLSTMVGRSGASVLRAALVTGQSPQLAVPDIREHLGQGGEQNLDLACQQAGQGLTAAAIGNVVHIDLGARLQELALEMGKRSDP